MEKNILLSIIYLLVLQTTYSQQKTTTSKSSETYVSIKVFKQIYNRDLTKNDLQHLKIRGKDTLILIKDKSKAKEYISKINNKAENKILGRVQEHKAYMPLSQYKKRYKKVITQKDIDNFIFRNGDTLIMINNKEFYNKKISVPYQPKDSTFLEAYKDVVYLKYHYKKPTKEIRLRYWKNEIKIFMTKNVDRKVKKELKKFTKYLSKEVDSLKISFVNKLEKSNYIIYGINSEKDYKYEPSLKSKNIEYRIYWNGKQQFYHAKLKIDSRSYENKDDLILKSKKMFLKTLGQFSWSYKLPKEGYFSLKYFKEKKFTKLDLEILKYHYSYGICKGTNLITFEEQHKKAKEIFKKTGRHLQFIHLND